MPIFTLRALCTFICIIWEDDAEEEDEQAEGANEEEEDGSIGNSRIAGNK